MEGNLLCISLTPIFQLPDHPSNILNMFGCMTLHYVSNMTPHNTISGLNVPLCIQTSPTQTLFQLSEHLFVCFERV